MIINIILFSGKILNKQSDKVQNLFPKKLDFSNSGVMYSHNPSVLQKFICLALAL